jgi:acyl-CoA thioester hydrolase
MMQFEDYRHSIPIQVRFSDIDKLKHINNACYFTYFELGRIDYFNRVFKENINWSEKGFILAHTAADYLQPVHLDDEIYCFTKVIKVGKKSMTIKNSIVKKTGEKLVECTKGLVVLVAMDYSTNQSIEVPKKWVELMQQFEG